MLKSNKIKSNKIELIIIVLVAVFLSVGSWSSFQQTKEYVYFVPERVYEKSDTFMVEGEDKYGETVKYKIVDGVWSQRADPETFKYELIYSAGKFLKCEIGGIESSALSWHKTVFSCTRTTTNDIHRLVWEMVALDGGYNN